MIFNRVNYVTDRVQLFILVNLINVTRLLNVDSLIDRRYIWDKFKNTIHVDFESEIDSHAAQFLLP